MARFLSGLFGDAPPRTAALERKTAADKRAQQGAGYTYAGNPYIDSWNVDRMVKDGYEKVIWVFKALDAIASKASSYPIRCYQGDKDDDPSEWRKSKDPILDLLNVRSNDLDGAAKLFRYRISTQWYLSKKGVFVEAIPNKAGTAIAALNLLPPALTYPVPNEDGVVTQFEIQLAQGDRPRLQRYDPKSKRGVLWMRKPHPTNPYMGVTPLEAAGISIDLDFYARLYNRNFLLNDGRAGQLVAIKGGLSPEDAAEIKRRFQPGMGGVGRTTVVEADSVSVQDTAVTPRDAQYAELRNITKDDLLIAMGTPESVVGNASGRTFDNADAEKENWLTETVLPHLEDLEVCWEQMTEGGWDDDKFLKHDTSREPVLGRAKRAKQDKARDDFDKGRITLLDLWDILELDIDKDMRKAPGVDVVWLDVQSKLPAGSDDAMERAAKLMPVGQPSAFPAEGDPNAAFGADGGQPADQGGDTLDTSSGSGWDPSEAITPGTWDPSSAAVIPIDRARERAANRAAEGKDAIESDDPLEVKAYIAAQDS